VSRVIFVFYLAVVIWGDVLRVILFIEYFLGWGLWIVGFKVWFCVVLLLWG